MKNKNKFNVLLWDFNTDKLVHYDILPYLRRRYDEYKARVKENPDYWKVPVTLDDFKRFVERESQYQYWSRCEYEMICHGWPVRESDYKLDVHEQIMMNIDVVAEILYDEMRKETTRDIYARYLLEEQGYDENVVARMSLKELEETYYEYHEEL